MSDETTGVAPLEFDRFEFVLRRRPASPPELAEEESETLQRRHFGHLSAVHDAEHLVVASPSTSSPTSASVACARTTRLHRANRALAERDPAILAGRLEVEVVYPFCEKGAIRVPWSDGASPVAPHASSAASRVQDCIGAGWLGERGGYGCSWS